MRCASKKRFYSKGGKFSSSSLFEECSVNISSIKGGSEIIFCADGKAKCVIILKRHCLHKGSFCNGCITKQGLP
jgi:hypothetical protein